MSAALAAITVISMLCVTIIMDCSAVPAVEGSLEMEHQEVAKVA